MSDAPVTIIGKDAQISECGKYRYTLTRRFSTGVGSVTWLMLNPSTADSAIDDPTIRRCMSFSQTWGRQWMFVRNLYAFRSKTPSDLWSTDDPVGPLNNNMISSHQGDIIICAWGRNAKPDRVREVYDLLKGNVPMLCLGTNSDGSPKHPLYIKQKTQLIDWRMS